MRHLAFSILIFIVLFSTGLQRAAQLPLENDEWYSQQNSIEQLSYLDILKGAVPEGNNAPLFYINQKFVSDLLSIKLKDITINEEHVCNPNAQILLRLLPIFYVSLGLSIAFFYFSCNFNIWFGIISILLFLTTPSVWIYWVQSRPYGLWFLLSVAQIILLLKYIDCKNRITKNDPGLFTVHLLLCLCNSFGIMQTCASIIILRKEWFKFALIPACIATYYAVHAPHYPFRVPSLWFENLIAPNITLERITILVGLCILLKSFSRFISYALCLFIFAFLLIGYIMSKKVPGLIGFELSSRYFFYLAPLTTILIVTLLKQAFDQFQDNLWARLCLLISVVGLITLGALRTWIVLWR